MTQALQIEGNGTNRFCIVVKSEMTVGDMEWAAILMLLNMTLERSRYGHVEAHLEEPKKK